MFNYKNEKGKEDKQGVDLRYHLRENGFQAFGSVNVQLPANLKVSQ